MSSRYSRVRSIVICFFFRFSFVSWYFFHGFGFDPVTRWKLKSDLFSVLSADAFVLHNGWKLRVESSEALKYFWLYWRTHKKAIIIIIEHWRNPFLRYLKHAMSIIIFVYETSSPFNGILFLLWFSPFVQTIASNLV